MEADNFRLRQWSMEELDLMFTRRLKPLLDRIDELEKEVDLLKRDNDILVGKIENLGKKSVNNWNELVKMIKARTSENY